MTKNQTNYYWLDTILFIDSVAIVATSLIIDGARGTSFVLLGLDRPTWVIIHIITAVILLGIHLILHWAWIKVAFKSTDKLKPKQLRRNRAIDIGLFVVSVLLGLSGLFIWPLSGNLEEGNPLRELAFFGLTYGDWKFMHSWGGLIMLGLIIIHLGLHWKWVVSTTRRIFAKEAVLRLR